MLFHRGISIENKRPEQGEISRRRAARGLVTLLVLLYCFGLLTTQSVQADSVRLKRSAVVADTAESILLRDIAELSGAEVLSAGDVAVMSAVDLRNRSGQAVTLDDVRQALASRRLNPGRIAFSGDKCEIQFAVARKNQEGDRKSKRDTDQEKGSGVISPGVWASTVMDEGTLRGQIARFVMQLNREQPASSIRIIFKDRDADQLELSALVHDFEITPQGTARSPELPMLVRVFLGDRFVRSFRISVGIRLQQDVYVAQRYIARGEFIRPGDFKVVSMLISPNPVSPMSTLEKAEGLEARGRITRGEIVRDGAVLTPVTVRRNQTVTLMIKRGAFTITTKGVVMEKGRVGDVVRVQPALRKSVLKARIGPEGVLTVVGH